MLSVYFRPFSILSLSAHSTHQALWQPKIPPVNFECFQLRTTDLGKNFFFLILGNIYAKTQANNIWILAQVIMFQDTWFNKTDPASSIYPCWALVWGCFLSLDVVELCCGHSQIREDLNSIKLLAYFLILYCPFHWQFLSGIQLSNKLEEKWNSTLSSLKIKIFS